MAPWEDYLEEGISPQLQMYRLVQDYPDHPNHCDSAEASLIGIRVLYREKNPEYWRQRTLLETAYQEWKTEEAERKRKEAEVELAKLKVTAPSNGACPTCGQLPLEPVEDMDKWKLLELLE